jgi:hypothetical protein
MTPKSGIDLEGACAERILGEVARQELLRLIKASACWSQKAHGPLNIAPKKRPHRLHDTVEV